MKTPHPIPYQGSKRRLANIILRYFPEGVRTLYEPFAGSAAVTLAAARRHRAESYWISDVLAPLMGIWEMVLRNPRLLADEYEDLWQAQLDQPRAFYMRVRDEFNESGDCARLLYLIARCVKNSIRFNPQGQFNQSADHRRRGMHPETMRRNIMGASRLLTGTCTLWTGDYREAVKGAESQDLIYMDPPYQGVSGRDPRYVLQVRFDELMSELERLNSRRIRYLLSYDGSCGLKSYGEAPPDDLGLTRVSVHVGKSAQATLSGRSEDTVESLYVSPALASELGAKGGRVSVGKARLQRQLFE